MMSLNILRDEVGNFLRMVDPESIQSDENILAMLDEKYSELKQAESAQLPHKIYDVMFVLFELAAKHNYDLDMEWDAGRIRKRKYQPK